VYIEHFKLTQLPFGLTPDTHFFCKLPTYQEALNVLLLALQNGEGFIKITGNVGTGKTMLCRKLLNELRGTFATAYIPNPNLTASGLRTAIADELGINCPRNTGQSRMLQQINQHLINIAANGKKTVLIIDEAQAMSLETLEALRLLTNLETEKQKLLQIVLFGQPELDTLLKNKAIRQLRQRITFSYCLKPLNKRELKNYIQHRLALAGQTKLIFSFCALRALHQYSRGIPRLINILSHKAMLCAYGKGRKKIGLKEVQTAAMDTEDTKNQNALGLRIIHALTIGFVIGIAAWLRMELI
jgi:MSHA biogenesis protein MshM